MSIEIFLSIIGIKWDERRSFVVSFACVDFIYDKYAW